MWKKMLWGTFAVGAVCAGTGFFAARHFSDRTAASSPIQPREVVILQCEPSPVVNELFQMATNPFGDFLETIRMQELTIAKSELVVVDPEIEITPVDVPMPTRMPMSDEPMPLVRTSADSTTTEPSVPTTFPEGTEIPQGSGSPSTDAPMPNADEEVNDFHRTHPSCPAHPGCPYSGGGSPRVTMPPFRSASMPMETPGGIRTNTTRPASPQQPAEDADKPMPSKIKAPIMPPPATRWS